MTDRFTDPFDEPVSPPREPEPEPSWLDHVEGLVPGSDVYRQLEQAE